MTATTKAKSIAEAKSVAIAALAITDKTSASKKNKVTPKQWAEMEAIWEAGVMTRKTISDKYKVSERTIQKHMKNKSVNRGAKAAEHREKVEEEIKKAQITDATILAGRIRETKEEHYKMVSGLAKLTWQEILTAKTKQAPMATAMNNLKALDAAISNLAKIRVEKWAILGLDKDTFIDEDGLPELTITELTADEVMALRNREMTEFDNIPANAIQDGEIEDEENEIVEEED